MLARRSMPEIVHEILQSEGKRKTQIMYRTALTHSQLMRYLDVLVKRGLIQKQSEGNGGTVCRITENGRELLKHLSVVIKYLGILSYDD